MNIALAIATAVAIVVSIVALVTSVRSRSASERTDPHSEIRVPRQHDEHIVRVVVETPDATPQRPHPEPDVVPADFVVRVDDTLDKAGLCLIGDQFMVTLRAELAERSRDRTEASPTMVAERAIASVVQAVDGGRPWETAHRDMQAAFDAGSRVPQLLLEMTRCSSPRALAGCAAEFNGASFDDLLDLLRIAVPADSAIGQLVRLERLIADPWMVTPDDVALTSALGARYREAQDVHHAVSAARLALLRNAGASLDRDAVSALLGDQPDPLARLLDLSVRHPQLSVEPSLQPLVEAILPAAILADPIDETTEPPSLVQQIAEELARRLRPRHGLTAHALPVAVGDPVADRSLTTIC